MVSELFIQIVLSATIVAQIGLILLLLSSRRHALVRWVIIALSVTCVIWPAGLLTFIMQTDDLELATTVAKIFYLDGALIGVLLVILAHLIPYRRPFSRGLIIVLGIIVSIITITVLLPIGMIESVQLNVEHNSVALNEPLYNIYVLFFGIVIAITLAYFTAGYRKAVRDRQHQIAAQTRTMIAGLAIALAFGFWFNVLLPYWGDYSYIWAGPPFTLLFVVAMFYAIIRQGLFDLRAALARSSAYLLLLITMVGGYAIVVFTVTNLFFGQANQQGALLTYVVLALFFTITYSPVKLFFDQLTYRLFYRDNYDLNEGLLAVTEITSDELELSKLVRKSLDVVEQRLAPAYVAAYIVGEDGKIRHFTAGPKPPTHRQRQLQIDVVGTLLDRLPRVLDAHDSQILDETGAQQSIRRADVSMLLQFVVQRKHIGALFLGDKQSGSGYSDKDLQLLTTMADELALAIQNSQRFEEIEHFNDTLQSRVDSATKRLRHNNQELKKLDHAKDEFVSLASHQLRTPLTSIKGYLSLVLDEDVGKINADQRKLLGHAFASSERMARLIGDFLSISRLQTDKFDVELEPADVNKIIEQTMVALQPIATEHKVELSFEGVVGKHMMMVDAAKIQQVVMNLVDNAIFYSLPGGKVNVSLGYRDGKAIFTVTDTGIGVPKSEQEGLFSKFYRASNARKRRPDGTGIGLFLVKRIVIAHHGSIVFRTTEDKGSVFGFSIPMKRPNTTALDKVKK